MCLCVGACVSVCVCELNNGVYTCVCICMFACGKVVGTYLCVCTYFYRLHCTIGLALSV